MELFLSAGIYSIFFSPYRNNRRRVSVRRNRIFSHSAGRDRYSLGLNRPHKGELRERLFSRSFHRLNGAEITRADYH